MQTTRTHFWSPVTVTTTSSPIILGNGLDIDKQQTTNNHWYVYAARQVGS
jgi:hypothetical protein